MNHLFCTTNVHTVSPLRLKLDFHSTLGANVGTATQRHCKTHLNATAAQKLKPVSTLYLVIVSWQIVAQHPFV